MDRRIHYLFVDLGYLRDKYRVFAGKWFQGEGGLDFQALHRHAHAPPKTFYYAREERDQAGNPQGRAGQDEYFDRIRSVPGTHVQTGEPAGTEPDARQKGVDVQLAVDMLRHATRGKMTHATLMSGDAAFAPVVRALVEMGVDVTVWAEAASVARSLRVAADNFLPIQWQDYHHWTEERIGATALLPGVGSGEISKLEGARESFARNGWNLLESGTVGDAGNRADLWAQDTPVPKQYSLAIEQHDAPDVTSIVRVSHSDRGLLLRYADIEWGSVSLAPAQG